MNWNFDPFLLKGRSLINKHTGLSNKVVDVVPGWSGDPIIYLAPGTSHDMWPLEKLKEHYNPPHLK